MSDPLRVVATLHCVSGAGEQAAAAVRACVLASRNEPGCLEYAAYRAEGAPDRITVVELWESQAALDAHNRTAHLQELVTAVRPLAAAPIEILVLTEIS